MTKDRTVLKPCPRVEMQSWPAGRDVADTFTGWAEKITVKGKRLVISAIDQDGRSMLITVDLPADEISPSGGA